MTANTPTPKPRQIDIVSQLTVPVKPMAADAEAVSDLKVSTSYVLKEDLKALIEKNDITLQGKKVLILGSGGTSKTALAVAKDFNSNEILFSY
mgnify:CR=1 FL=1